MTSTVALRSQDTVELLVALYRVLKPALLDAYRAHLEQTHPLVDQPTRRFLRFIIQEEEEMIEWGEAALTALTQEPEAQERADAWEAHLHAYLGAAGGVAGGSVGVWEYGSVGVEGPDHTATLPHSHTLTLPLPYSHTVLICHDAGHYPHARQYAAASPPPARTRARLP